MTISIDQSIGILKAEILARDQQLPPQRIPPLQDAFACLKLRFKSRKNILAILGMAEGVLQYQLKRDAHADPECLDFLKEAMAQVVNIYEEGRFDPQQEEELGQRMYRRFTTLREHLKSLRNPSAGTSPASPKAGEAAPGEQLPQSPPPPLEKPEAESTPRRSPPSAAPSGPSRAAGGSKPREYTPGIGGLCRTITVGNLTLAVAEEEIALHERLKPRARGIYIASSQIPLKDFSRLLRPLAGRFQGALAAIPGRRLKKLHLPLMIPKGGGLALLPDEKAQDLLVISHGQWHGAVIGTITNPDRRTIERWQAAANGDISGLVTLDDENSYPLLNPRSLLEREGFLIATEE